MSNKTLYFGGAFSPVHFGHLLMAQHVVENLEYSNVVFIPTNVSSQKQCEASYADRIEMCKIATAGNPIFSVSDIERNLPKPSYTTQTIAAIRSGKGSFNKNSNPEKIHWLIGGDQAENLHTWHNTEQLVQDAYFVIVDREGFCSQPKIECEHVNIEEKVSSFSSTLMREKLKTGKSIQYMTDDNVVAYIKRCRLYVHSVNL